MMQEWFTDAKLGIFIHWGIYAVNRFGGASWPIFRGEISWSDYMKQMEGFTAEDYNPEAWADLFERSGAKYAVLTAKHHDGVALWPTQQGSPSIPNQTGIPDLVQGYVDALRKTDLKVGLYFSHTDWSNLDDLVVMTNKSKEELMAIREVPTDFVALQKAAKVPDRSGDAEVSACWDRFMSFHRAQLNEILGNYGPIDLIWFDGRMTMPGFDYPNQDIRDFIHSKNETTVINSRLDKAGDYKTPEQFIPIVPEKGPWELCMTIGPEWGYSGEETDNCKSPFEIIQMLCECVGMGGNMLLNIGPDAKGRIPAPQAEVLEILGTWMRKHAEGVYGTVRGLPHGFAFHSSSFSKDRGTLYLYMAHRPREGEGTPIKGLKNEIKKVTVVGNGADCGTHRLGGAPWMGVPGTLWIQVPEEAYDDYVTVLKIDLDGPVDLYGGAGVEIELN